MFAQAQYLQLKTPAQQQQQRPWKHSAVWDVSSAYYRAVRYCGIYSWWSFFFSPFFFLTGPTSETVEEDVAHSFLIILRIYYNPQLIMSGCVHKILSLVLILLLLVPSKSLRCCFSSCELTKQKMGGTKQTAWCAANQTAWSNRICVRLHLCKKCRDLVSQKIVIKSRGCQENTVNSCRFCYDPTNLRSIWIFS